MKTKIEYPRNGFSHHALVAKTEVTIKFAKRDADYLADFGIDEIFIDGVESKIQKLENISTYLMDKERKVLSTRLRDDARNEYYKSLRSVRKRFSVVFPTSSIEYKQTMNFKLSTSCDNDFIAYAEKMIDGLTNYSSKLSIVGIKDEQINNLQNQLVDFKSVVNNNTYVQKNTNENTKLRAELLNSTFSDLSHLCKVGKIVWEDENPARYMDYLLKDRRKKSKANSEAEDSPPSDTIYEELDSLK